MRPSEIHKAVPILKREIRKWKDPAVGVVQKETRDPFLILVSTLLSLRTKDPVTEAASKRLFKLARTPRALSRLSSAAIRRAIYPVCFYRVKTGTLKAVAKELLSRHGGKVPDDIDALTALKGVGRKTANLVVTLGFGKPGICVDTHVHRICNRWGYVRTKTPDETETALRRKLPGRYWIILNDLLVPYGQNLCVPVSPHCSRCRIARYCRRVGVARFR